MAGRVRRRSSAASLELSAASRAAWVAAGRSAALITARASSENLTSDPSPFQPMVRLTSTMRWQSLPTRGSGFAVEEGIEVYFRTVASGIRE